MYNHHRRHKKNIPRKECFLFYDTLQLSSNHLCNWVSYVSAWELNLQQ